MPEYSLNILSPGRGLREARVVTSSVAAVRKQAERWLETGSEVTVTAPTGRTTEFIVGWRSGRPSRLDAYENIPRAAKNRR